MNARHRLQQLVAVAALVIVSGPLAAQQSATVTAAQRAWSELDFTRAIQTARRALAERLSAQDRVQAYEILAFSYGALDSARQAVEAFRELIFLDPNREPDVQRVSPRITSLYASALGQVLVVRHARIDSTTFIAGQGAAQVQFSLSRPARAVVRVVGPGVDVVIDSQLVAGMGGVRWGAVTPNGDPLPPGRYQILVAAIEGANEFSVPVPIEIRHGQVDTVAHLMTLPGYTRLPESEAPPRDWKPLGISVLYAGLSTGAAVALSDPGLGDNWRAGAATVSFAALIGGFVMSIRKPDVRPVEANIRYNQLLDEQLAQQNAQIARDNAARRRQVQLTVVRVSGS